MRNNWLIQYVGKYTSLLILFYLIYNVTKSKGSDWEKYHQFGRLVKQILQ